VNGRFGASQHQHGGLTDQDRSNSLAHELHASMSSKQWRFGIELFPGQRSPPLRGEVVGFRLFAVNEGTMMTTSKTPATISRRSVVRGAAIASAGLIIDPALRAVVHAQGSDKPEKTEVRIGFIPLTDCASIVMASVLGFDKKYGITIVPTKEASWAGVRDKLVNGELDMAHVLYGLVYGVHMGVGGPRKDMAVLMTLNQNGQAITLSKKLADAGAKDAPSLVKAMAADKREYTFAQTFPTGTHAMWLYYWLASAGVNPLKDVKVITVPPPQMVANMRVGNMDGFCVGEPWNHRAILDGIGITAATTQEVWKDHPEKVLGATGDFVKKHPNTARAVIMAVLEAGRWIDANLQNKNKMAETVADKSYVNTSVDAINQRILGRYQNGLGKTWDDPNAMKFFADGAVNYPYLSDGMWFLTQHKRWGLLQKHPDYMAVARAINQTELYKQAASALKVSVPTSDLRTSKLIDGVVWDGKDPAKYADAFAVRVSTG
jgi:nitrate/nitrite transport system substrate-binding protein